MAMPRAPEWFARLIGIPSDTQTIPIEVGGRKYGAIVIASEPGDEIAEVWTDLSELLRLWVTACLGLTVLLYAAIGYWLRPLATVNGALRALQAGNYRVRVPPIATPDLAAIGHGCNSLATMVRMTVAGLGLSVLPCDLLKDELQQGTLVLAAPRQAFPPNRFLVAHHAEAFDTAVSLISDLAVASAAASGVFH